MKQAQQSNGPSQIETFPLSGAGTGAFGALAPDSKRYGRAFREADGLVKALDVGAAPEMGFEPEGYEHTPDLGLDIAPLPAPRMGR